MMEVGGGRRGVLCVERRLEKVLFRDDKVSFVKLLRNNDQAVTASAAQSLVEKCAQMSSKKCILALLNGEVCDSDALPALDSSSPVLAYLCHSCAEYPQLIHLMLLRCKAIPLVNVPHTVFMVHAFPIQFVLLKLSYMKHYFELWAVREESVIKLVFLLCLWKTKPILDSARLLAQYTDPINHIAWSFIKFGAVIEFGALLIIAREKVMAPFNTGLTIREYLTNEINSLPRTTEFGSEQDEYKNMLVDAHKLLGIFDRAGDALSQYCSSMQKYVAAEDMITDVCDLLMKNKVYVNRLDLVLDPFFKRNRGLCKKRQSTLKNLESYDISKGDWYDAHHPRPDFQVFHYGLDEERMQPGYIPAERLKLTSVFSPSQPRFMSTSCPINRRSSKPLERAQHLAYRSFMKLKNGLRF